MTRNPPRAARVYSASHSFGQAAKTWITESLPGAGVEQWTPRSGSHILLTTRYAEWDDMVAKVEVGVLARKAAIEFLLRRGKKKPEEREAAGRLADALACLPLALDHAASYCALGRRPSFDEYLGMLEARLDYEPTGTSALMVGAYAKRLRLRCSV